MILRIDRLAIELPMPEHPSPNSASAVQELLGGKFGEMSTLMNYTFQSFNFRGRDQMRPFYDLIANIAAEEYGHIELVSYTINMLLSGSTMRGDDPSGCAARERDGRAESLSLHRQRSVRAADGLDGQSVERHLRLLQREPEAGPAAQLLPRVRRSGEQDPRLRDGRRSGGPRDGRLPAGPRRRRTSSPTPRRSRALTGVDVGKLLPIPDISNKRFPEALKHEAKGLHRIMYRLSPDDYREMGADLERTAPGRWNTTPRRRRTARRRACAAASGRAAADVSNRT